MSAPKKTFLFNIFLTREYYILDKQTTTKRKTMFQDHYEQVMMANDTWTQFKYVLLSTVIGPERQVFKSLSLQALDVIQCRLMWFATFHEYDYIFYDENGTAHDGTFWDQLVCLDEYRTGYRFESQGNIVYSIIERILMSDFFHETCDDIRLFTQMLCDRIVVEDRYQLLMSCLVNLEDTPNQTSDFGHLDLLDAACDVIYQNLKELDANFYYVNLCHEVRLKYGLNVIYCDKLWLQNQFGDCLLAKNMKRALPKILLGHSIAEENRKKSGRFCIE